MKFLLDGGRSLGNIPADWHKLGQGGSGTVYKHPKKMRGAVVKLYHVSPKDYAAEHEAKVRAMLETPPAHVLSANGIVQLAWPFDRVRDSNGKFCGIVMPEIDMTRSCSLGQVMAPGLRQKNRIPENPLYRLLGASNLVRVMRNLHSSGHHAIDLKPSNIRIYRPSHRPEPVLIAVMGCDGFAVRDRKGQLFPASFVTPEYLHPGVSLTSDQNFIQLGREQDLYALAVILFQLLNNNIHPFQSIDIAGAGYPTELPPRARISPPLYAYGLQPHPHVQPVSNSLHRQFAPDLRLLFDRAFLAPANLPDTSEWLTVLARLGDKSRQKQRAGAPWPNFGRLRAAASPPKRQGPTSQSDSNPNRLHRSALYGKVSQVANPDAPLWGWIFSTALASVLSFGFASLLPHRLILNGPSIDALIVEAIGFGTIGYISFYWLPKRLGRWWARQRQGRTPIIDAKVKNACLGLWALIQVVIAPTTGGTVSIPGQFGHLFRYKPATHSDGNRPPIPMETGHPFRWKPATHSDGNRPPIPMEIGHPGQGA